jgi:site-specific DNA-methyltransferase (adenine-specific)
MSIFKNIKDFKKEVVGNAVLFNEDCLKVMPKIADKSIDMILCDLPYQMTSNKWDILIDLDTLFSEYERVVKVGGVIALTASQPFTSYLIMQRPNWFKTEWIWQKNAGSNFGSVKYVPMKEHESIIILSNGGGKTTYNPQMQERAESGKERVKSVVNYNTKTDNYEKSLHNEVSSIRPELRYPSSVQKFNRERGLHPTQKPLELIEYLIKTYSNEGELILDNTFGSNTTGLGCKNLNRKYIGIEMDEKYFEIGVKRLKT